MNIEDWLAKVSAQVNIVQNERNSIVIQGDFNVDIMNQELHECFDILKTYYRTLLSRGVSSVKISS